ncbi:hypothetical protein At1D1609_43710 [Agrobacterium tumefaciens]|uniref:Uncharacterized protein n=1 Tax=Agrobacterium tumefaciens TaxID=358 RepID=A0A2L2LJA2_AGRTU|nr:hypothetical protein At1D1609_43710 [Agrobacterium tumefaciens]
MLTLSFGVASIGSVSRPSNVVGTTVHVSQHAG